MALFDAQFFKPFIDGTVKTIGVQCHLEASPQKPFFKDKPGSPTQETIEIAGVIGIVSEAFTGNITLSFTSGTFLAIMGNMLGEKYTEITKDLEDGAAELLNIIFGQAKITLNNQGYNIEKAIPTVVRGTGIRTLNMSKTPTLVLPFTTPSGPFYVEICSEGKSL